MTEAAKAPGKNFLKKLKKCVDIWGAFIYNNSCVTDKELSQVAGCSSAWLERLVWDQEVAGSNPVTPMHMQV